MTDTTEGPNPQDASADSSPIITSRFLFVDVAAQRAKQLRRGAVPRIEKGTSPHKLERVAMEEVRSGLIQYTLPEGYDSSAKASSEG